MEMLNSQHKLIIRKEEYENPYNKWSVNYLQLPYCKVSGTRIQGHSL
jgi:hypothetical protein